MSILISILVSLLGAFLSALFKAWFDKHPLGAYRTASYRTASPDLVAHVAASKADFLAKVKWHVWLGPKRTVWASSLYDRAAARMDTHSFQSPDGLAAAMIDGLAKLTPADLEPKQALRSGERAFKILPNGLVQGGTAAYSLDPKTGDITYRAAVKIGKWLLSKTYQASGAYKVDPALLQPPNLTVGKVVTLGDLQMRVVSISQGTLLVALSVPGQSMTGKAILATAPELALNSMDVTASVMGLSLVLGVRPA